MATKGTYSEGLAILQRLFSYLRPKVNFTTYLESLKKTWDGTPMSEEDFKEYVTGLSEKKNMFLKIKYKTVNDFDAILKSIASRTPYGNLPDRKMIDSAFIDPKNFKASFIDKIALYTSATKEVAKTTVKVAAGAGTLLLVAKIVGAGIAAYLIVKSLGQKKGYIK